MIFSKLTLALASLLALANSAVTRPWLNKDLEPPSPWQVTRLSTAQPSGRPGSSPFAHIFANITNPSPIHAGPGASFDASSANCTVDWVLGTAQPYGIVYECTTAAAPTTGNQQSSASASSAKWTVEILETDPSLYAPTEKLDVRFTLTSDLTVDGRAYSKVLAATRHFEVGDNMRGICGGSGVVR